MRNHNTSSFKASVVISYIVMIAIHLMMILALFCILWDRFFKTQREYGAKDHLIGFGVIAVIILADHFTGRLIIAKKHLTIKHPLIVHGADILLLLPMFLIVTVVELSKIGDPYPIKNNEIIYLIVFYLTYVLTIFDRIMLIRFSKKQRE